MAPTPVEIDTALADLWTRWSRVDNQVASYRKASADPFTAKRYANRLAEAESECRTLKAEIRELEALYTGWSRFFLVTNTNGHIHSSMNCSTCYLSTTFSWLPQLSGSTERDAVEECGEILCSVCFPSAPVAWTTGVSKTAAATKDARATAKAAQQAKKLAKALLPDGSVLVIHYDRLATLTGAKSWLTDAYSWNRNHQHPYYLPEDVQRVAEAVSAKTSEPVDEILAAADKRSLKRDGLGGWG